MAKEHEELIVITKTYDLILWSCKHTAKFPRNHRFVLGERIERSLYGILEGLLTAKYSRDRAPVLAQVNLSPEILRFQLRLAKDLECLRGNSYGFAARAVDEIGRLVGGWIRRADQGQPLSANRGEPLSAGRPAPAIVELPLHGGRCRVAENTLNPIQNETCDKQSGRFKQRVAPAAQVGDHPTRRTDFRPNGPAVPPARPSGLGSVEAVPDQRGYKRPTPENNRPPTEQHFVFAAPQFSWNNKRHPAAYEAGWCLPSRMNGQWNSRLFCVTISKVAYCRGSQQSILSGSRPGNLVNATPVGNWVSVNSFGCNRLPKAPCNDRSPFWDWEHANEMTVPN